MGNAIKRYVNFNLLGRDINKFYSKKIKSDLDFISTDINYELKKSLTNKNLDFIEMWPKNMTKNKDTLYLVKFYPNKPWQLRIKELAALSNQNNIVVIGLNTISYNMGKTVVPGIKEVENMIKNGIKPKNIILEGLCIGGAIATLTTKHFYDRGLEVNLYADRTFSKAYNVHTKKYLENTPNSSIIRKKLIKTFVSPFENFMTTIHNSKQKIGDTFYNLYLKNPDRIHYQVYRAEKNIKKDNDEVISYDNNIHAVLKEYRQKLKKPIKNSIELIEKHNCARKGGELSSIQTLINEVTINKIRYTKLMDDRFVKREVLQKFNSAICELEKNNTTAALEHLYAAKNFLTNKNKVARIYKDSDVINHNLNGRFLYNRASNSLVYPNHEIKEVDLKNTLNISKLATTESSFSKQISNIKKLNQIEFEI